MYMIGYAGLTNLPLPRPVRGFPALAFCWLPGNWTDASPLSVPRQLSTSPCSSFGVVLPQKIEINDELNESVVSRPQQCCVALALTKFTRAL